MKNIVLTICLFITLLSNGQITTLYTEDFSNDWKKGAITYGGVTPSQPTDGNWSWVSVGSPDNDGGSAKDGGDSNTDSSATKVAPKKIIKTKVAG